MALIFINFDNSYQEHQAREAYNRIDRLVSVAHSALIRIRYSEAEQERFRRWFGDYSQQNKNTVWRIINAIHGALRKDIRLIKGGAACEPDDYAYVQGDQIGQTVNIYLCPMFFAAGINGRDTTVGTVIHELSHKLGRTQDHEYGNIACRALALFRPEQARNNADSYLYYCESFQ